MWLNNNEEQILGPFSKFVENNEDKKLKFIYKDGVELIVKYETEYESDNGLELNDKGYEEYWEMAFKIVEIISDDKNIYDAGKFVLVNYHNIPDEYLAIG